ncbi:MAG: ATP-binding protein [Anaerolineales bacterium]|nr:ATP-binding protein [Anaerolineales bacterium]
MIIIDINGIELTQNQHDALTSLLSDWYPEPEVEIKYRISHSRSQSASSRDSSATVVLVLRILSPTEFAGAAIVKLEQVSSAENSALVVKNNQWALDRLPGHVPSLIGEPASDPTGQMRATLYQWAGVPEGADVAEISTLAQLLQLDDRDNAEMCLRKLTDIFLGNPAFYEVAGSTVPVYELLAQTVNWGGKDRIRGWDIEGHKIANIIDRLKPPFNDPDQWRRPRLMTFDKDDPEPNPIAYIYEPKLWQDKTLSLCPKGSGHGDLHCSNIVHDTNSDRQHPYVIDWDTLSHGELASFDLEYLKLDMLLRCFKIGEPNISGNSHFLENQIEAWRETIRWVSGTNKSREPHNPYYLQAQPYLKILQNARQTLIDSWQPHARGFVAVLHQAYSLAAVAASMNFVRKSDLTVLEQRYILYYGAQHLHSLLDAIGINWRSGIVFQYEPQGNGDVLGPVKPVDPLNPLAEVKELSKFYDNKIILQVWERLAISRKAHDPCLIVIQGERASGKTSFINVLSAFPENGKLNDPNEGKCIYVSADSLIDESSSYTSSVPEFLRGIFNRILSQVVDQLQKTDAPLVRESLQNLQAWTNEVVENLEKTSDEKSDLLRCFRNAQNLASTTEHLAVVYFDELENLSREYTEIHPILRDLVDFVGRLTSIGNIHVPIAFLFAVNHDAKSDSLYQHLCHNMSRIMDRRGMESTAHVKLKPLSPEAAQSLYHDMVRQLDGPVWLQKSEVGVRWAVAASQYWPAYLKLLIWRALELAKTHRQEPKDLPAFFNLVFESAVQNPGPLQIRLEQYDKHYLKRVNPETGYTTSDLMAWVGRWPLESFTPSLDGIRLDIWQPHLDDAYGRDLLAQSPNDVYWPHPFISAWMSRLSFNAHFEGLPPTPPPPYAPRSIWIHKRLRVVFINGHNHQSLGSKQQWDMLVYLAKHQAQGYCSYEDLFNHALEATDSKNVNGYINKVISDLWLQLDKVFPGNRDHPGGDREVVESVPKKGYCIPQDVLVIVID